MLFNSYLFIFIFLPFTLIVYFYLLRKRLISGAKGFLVFASLFFYSWWNPIYLPLIMGSMLFNFVVGNALTEGTQHLKIRKKILLTVGVFANLSLLGYFKYADFLIENINITFDVSLSLLYLSLPLAISFFTFQQIAYLVDSYRGETQDYDFLNYALFVTFFPQLIAGPIVHHKEMMPQFSSKFNLVRNDNHIALGIFIFSIGFFKKVIIADTFAHWVTQGYDHAGNLYLLEAWVTSLSYTFQLYFDFSGYTDMAIGIALLFNITLPINFHSPYKAMDIRDFWRRWHITLSRFLRDYIYIPLGGNRKGEVRLYANLMTTFILGGLWHGAGWTFIFWGFLHGIALVIHRLWKQTGFTMNKVLAWCITFNFINISWVFFRAREWGDAIKVLDAMFFGQLVLPAILYKPLPFLVKQGVVFDNDWLMHIHGNVKAVLWIVLCMLIILTRDNSGQLQKKFVLNRKTMMATVVLFTTATLGLNQVSEFLYFNF